MSLSTLDIINIMRKRGRGDPPSALSDIFVAPLTRVLNFLSAKMDLGRAEQTVDGILLLLDNPTLLENLALALNETIDALTLRLTNALDDIASNFGIVRRTAIGASGSVLFMRSADPQTALPITIPAGTRVSSTSTGQDYRVPASVIVNQMVRNTVYNKFVVSIPVVADSVGLTTNASVEEVTQLKDSVPGITSVINPNAITGGRDEESDTELATRIKTALSTNNIGTQVGYRNTVLQVGAVKDASVIGAGDPLMVRDLGDGGAIDIYVTDPVPVTVSVLADGSNTEVSTGGTWNFTPARQPIINDIDAVVPAADVVGIFKDTSVYAGSTRARDYIKFDTDPTLLGFPVQYAVNNLITDVRDYMNAPERKLLGADILIKEAVITLVDVTCQIVILGNFSFSTVQSNVENAVTQAIAALTIGQSLELSDIIVVIASVPGVDRVTIPFQKFNIASETGSVNVITAVANEVLRPGNVIVTL
jgi:uncharacterized phage protein gp47/JayE